MGSGINSVGAYYFDDNSVLKYLRKVLAEINPGYVDCGIRSAFLLKRYIERNKYNIHYFNIYRHIDEYEKNYIKYLI